MKSSSIFKQMTTLFFRTNAFVLLMITVSSCSQSATEGPYMATGIKIGEVSQTEAIVWVRLTENSARIGNDAPMPDVKYIDPETGELTERKNRPNRTPVLTYPEGYTIKTIQGASPEAKVGFA